MDKYFETLDMAAFRMQHEMDSPKAMRLFRHVLDVEHEAGPEADYIISCLLYTSPSPRDRQKSRMPSSA